MSRLEFYDYEEKLRALVAHATDALSAILLELAVPFAFCGTTAYNIYTGSSSLERVEVMILSSPETTSSLKGRIISTDPKHFFTPYKGPKALRYRLHDPTAGVGVLDIDIIASNSSREEGVVWSSNGLPLVPLSFLFLQELEAWTLYDNRQAKAFEIIQMLNKIQRPLHNSKDHLFNPTLYEYSEARVKRFVLQYPTLLPLWKNLGLGLQIELTELASTAYTIVTQRTVETAANPPKAITPNKPFSKLEIRELAAQTAVVTLRTIGLPCAIFGSMACHLYGNYREPNDVDILILPPKGMFDSQEEQEKLKDAIVSANPEHFWLKPARDRTATYRVLFYRVNGLREYRGPKLSSKVDILFPGIMNLPDLPEELISWRRGLPVVPFAVLLLQKVQAWHDHKTATAERYILKAPVDVEDLAWMLNVRKYVKDLEETRPWHNRGLFSEEFQQLSADRVREQCVAYPHLKAPWIRLGFEVN